MQQSAYTLSVIIPCFNAKDILRPLLARIHTCEVPALQVVVVDDASTDGTREMLENEWCGLLHKVVYLEKKAGKSVAVAAGAATATGQWAIVQNTIIEYDPLDYPKLLAPLLNGTAQASVARGWRGGTLSGVECKETTAPRLADFGDSVKAFALPTLRQLLQDKNPEHTFTLAQVYLPRRDEPIKSKNNRPARRQQRKKHS